MIRSFELDDVASAAGLLVRRHALHRLTSPLLKPLDLPAAEAAVRELALTGDGAVAVEGGQVVGYLLGTPRDSAAWGASTWVEPAGCAGAHVPRLWADCAGRWVAAGRRAHYAVLPRALVEEFFSLGFGLQHVHALQVPTQRPLDGRVRRAVRSDIPVLAELDVLLDEHLRASPVFSALTPISHEQACADWTRDIDDPAYVAFVAEIDGHVVGSAVGCDLSLSSRNRGLVAPERAALLAFAALLPAARGLGLGRALSEAVADWAASSGYPAIGTDWRSANARAARTWLSGGYRPTFLRLHRLVGH